MIVTCFIVLCFILVFYSTLVNFIFFLNVLYKYIYITLTLTFDLLTCTHTHIQSHTYLHIRMVTSSSSERVFKCGKLVNACRFQHFNQQDRHVSARQLGGGTAMGPAVIASME